MGTKLSGTEWQIAVIAAVFLLMPTSMFFAQGAFVSDTEYESYFSPERIDDFSGDYSLNGARNLDESSDYIDYAYYNDSDELQMTSDSGLYTKNQTGNDYHEYLAEGEEFKEFYGLSIGLNTTVDKAIEEDLSKVSFEAEFPRNCSVQIRFSANDADDRYRLETKDINVTTNYIDYDFDIDYSKLLDADSTLSEDAELTYYIRGVDEDVEAIQPGDGLQFNIDLQTDYTASPIFTTNLFSALWGIFFIGAAIFSTPVVDLADIRRLW